ncbi:MAG: hypothetical protein K2N60_07455 [Oscillospiraceae bacterium]|nr:hypothetical protein [Oscillospiraceae bacterium]
MPANDRDNSIFIRESRSVRNKRIAVIIIIDLMLAAIYGFFLYAALLNQSVTGKIIGVVFSAAVDIAIVWAMIRQEDKKFQSFADAVRNEDETVFADMERQAENAEKLFGAVYLLDDFLYVCNQNLFIPYTDIKKIRASFSSINFIPVAAALHIYCFSGKAYSVSLRSAGEYRRRQNEFEDRLERYRQQSFAKQNGQNMYYK